MATSYTRLGENIAVSNSTFPQFSQAVSMVGANACQVDVVIFNLGGATSLTVKVEGSNDLENWTPSALASYASLALGFNQVGTLSAVAWQYVRLRYEVAGTGTIIFSAGVSTSLN